MAYTFMGLILQITLTKRAITESRTAEESANQSKTNFLANMSHEIRTPLAAILGFSTLLNESNLDADTKNLYVETIVRNGKSLLRIIDDILDLAKVEAGKLDLENVSFSLYQLVTEIVDLFKDKTKEKNIFLSLSIDDGVPSHLVSDPTRGRQILINLIGNAVKFTVKGGVRVNVSAAPLGANKTKITIDVKDTDIGLSFEQQEKLFSPFVQADNSITRKFGGTGLGLALSQRLSEALSGEISIPEGSLDQGCTFRLTFIAGIITDIPKIESRIENTVLTKSKALEGLQILIVDDIEENKYLVSKLLIRNSALVDTASNGDEGARKALSGNYDAVLMDLQMPIMDGYQAKQLLDEKGYNKPVIALTAHAMNEERRKTKAAGFSGHLTKPASEIELIAMILQQTTRK